MGRFTQRITGLRTMAVTGLGVCLLMSGRSPAGAAPPVRAVAANGSYTDRSSHLTVLVTHRATDTRGGRYFHPARGKEWEFFYVIVRNGGSEAQRYNEFDFHVVDQLGQTWSPGFTLDDRYEPLLSSGKVPAHQQRAGWVGFEIPLSTRSVTVVWDRPDTFGDQAEIGRYTLR